MAKEKSVQSLLILPNHPLGAAVQRAGQLHQCNLRFQKILPKHLINKVNILNVRDRCVIIGVSNASLMTQLHFESEEILNEIKQLPGMQLTESIQFKVTHSTSNQVSLNNIAENIFEDSLNSNVDTANNVHQAIPEPESTVSSKSSAQSDDTLPVDGKNSAKRNCVTAYASEVLRQAASEVKDPLLQSVLLNLSKKAQ